jgi:hypothetical protein
MAGRSNDITIEGTVRRDSLDAMHLSHRISIVSTSGHTYEVEPSYIGRYLEKFEGHNVIAQARPMRNGKERSEIRIQNLRVLGRARADPTADSGGIEGPAKSDSREYVLSEPGVEEPSPKG